MADVQPAAQEAPVPFYKTVKRVSATALSNIQSFKDVSLDPGVNTDEFCEATDAVVAFFGTSSASYPGPRCIAKIGG
jgi:hypothetical protein